MSDFGTDSPYIVAMKVAIYERLPQAVIVDLTHAIAPQDVRQGAFVWSEFTKPFPARTVHVGVVDPGVGTKRRIIVARCGKQYFLCPDNGLLTLVLRENAPTELLEITNPVYWRQEISATFHGRDIIAPVAAALSGGVPLAELGTPLDTSAPPILFPVTEPFFGETEWQLEILYIDHFGNLLLNTTVEMITKAFHGRLTQNPAMAIHIHGRDQEVCAVFVSTYSCLSSGSLAMLEGSNGRLELAIVNGNAAERLSVKAGDRFTIRLIR